MGDDLTTRFQARWGFARGLTRDLLQFVDAPDLAFSPSNQLGPLWKHFRHLGRVQENYLRGIETGRVVFGFAGASYTGGASKQTLLDYFDRLDARLKEHLRAIDVNRRIEWFGSTVDVHEHLMRMADHEVLHHGMFIIYVRLLGRGFPPSWAQWAPRPDDSIVGASAGGSGDRVVDRRMFISTVASSLLAAPLGAEAQDRMSVHRVGLLSVPPAYLAAFEESLRQLGYARGKNIVFETPPVGTPTETRAGAAAELVRLKVDVIVTGPDRFIEVAKQATTTVPIVMVYGRDPVGRGYIASLTRPGGNITGLTWEPSPEIVGKHVELLTELSPRPARIAGIVDPTDPELPFRKEADRAARRLGVTLQYAEVRTASDVARAFNAVAGIRADAVLIFGGPRLWSYRSQIADLAKKNRLPTLYPYREGSEAGGLMSYGPSLIDSWRRAAIYVDKILKGAKPADLPVEQPTTFELVINLKTAKALGLTIPPSLLGRADQVIE